MFVMFTEPRVTASFIKQGNVVAIIGGSVGAYTGLLEGTVDLVGDKIQGAAFDFKPGWLETLNGCCEDYENK